MVPTSGRPFEISREFMEISKAKIFKENLKEEWEIQTKKPYIIDCFLIQSIAKNYVTDSTSKSKRNN